MTPKITLLFIFFFSMNISSAQTDCPCCSPQHQQFDFWVGDWMVYDTTGTLVGENEIVKLEDNCILSEHWQGKKGSTGRSYNYYNRADSTWNQVWIDNQGNPLVLKGKAQAQQMILKSEPVKGIKIDWYINQVTWTLNADQSVTQLWEILDTEGKLLQIAFKGIYKRKSLEKVD